MRDKILKTEARISAYDPPDQFTLNYDKWVDFDEALDKVEFINPDGTTEPFGQKVEG